MRLMSSSTDTSTPLCPLVVEYPDAGYAGRVENAHASVLFLHSCP